MHAVSIFRFLFAPADRPRQHPPATLGILVAMIALTAGSVTAVSGADATSGLIGFWPFDEAGAPYAVDHSGSGLDGLLHEVAWARGDFGVAAAFSGRHSYVLIPGPEKALDGSDELTVTAWVLWEETGRYPNIITGGRWSPGGFLIFVSDRLCSFRLGRPGYSAHDGTGKWQEIGIPLLNAIPLHKWVHLAAVFHRPDIRTYVNGHPVGHARWAYPIGFQGDMYLGCWTPGGTSHKGLIDEVRLYNRALSAAAIRALYDTSRKGRETSRYRIIRPDRRKQPRAALLTSQAARMGIGTTGRILFLEDFANHRDLLVDAGVLCTAHRAGRLCVPRQVRGEGDTLRVRCTGGVTVDIRVNTVAGTAFRVQIMDVQPPDVERVEFMRLPLFPGPDQGRTAGFIGDDRSGVCMRALNLRTRVLLDARSHVLVASAEKKYGIRGAAIGLVAGRRDRIQEMLQRLTMASDVARSPLGGAFSLGNPALRGSYLFARVSEANVGDWIALARRGGFADIHYSGWWRTLGHYDPAPSLFPHGLEGMRQTAERIHAAGMATGMHTLTGCISLRDPWVRPVPDPRLDADASYTLAADIDDHANRIPVAEKPAAHDIISGYASRGNYLRIGTELVQYAAISRNPPFAFLDCRRGVLGTKPALHSRGERVDHLRHLYNAFYPREDSDLVAEVAERIARVYDACGMSELYQDGAEGMGSTHAIAVIRRAIWEHLKRPGVIEASSWGHHSWWFHSRLGAWDHPKWGLKRFTDRHVAMSERLRRCNLLEPQMGWWALFGPSHISRGILPDEVEYFMAKCMSIDAAMSIQGVTVGKRPPNARQEEYFTLIGWYERLRLARYFDDASLARLRPPGAEVQLRQDRNGEWRFLPVVYRKHKINSGIAATMRWTADNPFASQPVGLRIEALYSLAPAQAPDRLVLAESADPASFTVRRTASKVSLDVLSAPADSAHGGKTLILRARNRSAKREGAWGQAGIRFHPYRDMRPGEGIALWVRGDGSGAVLNVQLTNPREYQHVLAEHYITVNFTGWRYVEIPFRERSAALYDDYKWPYYDQHGIFRTPLKTRVVDGLNLWLNNLPPDRETNIRVSAVRLHRLRRVVLRNPSLRFNGKTIVRLPFSLASGEYAELSANGRLVKYSERGEPLGAAAVIAPELPPGKNSVVFDCMPVSGANVRAEITLVFRGPAFGKPRNAGDIDRTHLDREYCLPRTVFHIDGRDNLWDVRVAPDRSLSRIEMEVRVEPVPLPPAAFTGPDAVLLDDCRDASRFAESARNRYVRYVYGNGVRGRPALPGVTFQVTVEKTPDAAPPTRTMLRFTARSTRKDNAGWCAVGRRFDPPLDLRECSRLGFRCVGDGAGEILKVQLRDVNGKWLDLVKRVDWTGERFCEFGLDSSRIDLGRIEYLLLFYNQLPRNGRRVECRLGPIAATRLDPRLSHPALTIGNTTVEFPVELRAGQRLVWDGSVHAELLDGDDQARAGVTPSGGPWRLHPGANPVRLDADGGIPGGLRVRVNLVKVYATSPRRE